MAEETTQSPSVPITTRRFEPIETSGLSDGQASSKAEEEPGQSRRWRETNQHRKPPGVWKKILWVKQSYPDNYTDAPTFLSHLQWNPRVVPYDFWPLVADSTVIVQHVCSVVIFVCCFVGIYQERVSPVSIAGWGSTCTFIGWVFWDAWIASAEQAREMSRSVGIKTKYETTSTNEEIASGSTLSDNRLSNNNNLSVQGITSGSSRQTSRTPSPDPNPSFVSRPAPSAGLYNTTTYPLSHRWQQRLATAKSAILIYAALLGLSPILKSLTMSTTSDSIWAMSTWLLLLNVFLYDYSGEGEQSAEIPSTVASTGTGSTKYQSSLSTNAALMASTVLASRLTTTTHVFSLTVFSIEVFGLFPVFRRCLRARSWVLHVLLTALLILVSGAALGLVLTDPASVSSISPVTGVGIGTGVSIDNDNPYPYPKTGMGTVMGKGIEIWFTNWRPAFAGALLWGMANAAAMGACSWWLISLQKYKNVVIGPWDPARPIVRNVSG